jgi:hypothetical protein
LAQFEGKAIRAGGVTYQFATDPKILDEFARAGLIAVEGLYRAIA